MSADFPNEIMAKFFKEGLIAWINAPMRRNPKGIIALDHVRV